MRGAGVGMHSYQRRLARLFDKAIHERDQDKVKKLLDEIFRLLAENQNGSTSRGPETRLRKVPLERVGHKTDD